MQYSSFRTNLSAHVGFSWIVYSSYILSWVMLGGPSWVNLEKNKLLINLFSGIISKFIKSPQILQEILNYFFNFRSWKSYFIYIWLFLRGHWSQNNRNTDISEIKLSICFDWVRVVRHSDKLMIFQCVMKSSIKTLTDIFTNILQSDQIK